MRGRTLTLAGLAAVLLLVVRAALDWHHKSGEPRAMLLIAAAIGVGLLLRLRYPRQ